MSIYRFIQSPFDFLTHIQVLINIQRNIAAAPNRIYAHARTTFLHKITQITYEDLTDSLRGNSAASFASIVRERIERKDEGVEWAGAHLPNGLAFTDKNLVVQKEVGFLSGRSGI